MKTGFRFAGLALAALGCFTVPALAQDKAKAAAPAAAAPSAAEKAEMEAMMKAATPGKEHKQLASMAGDWDVKLKMYNAPGAPAQESTGTSEAKMILGGRQLDEHFEGTMMGQPFSGMGMTGYDNVTKKYVATWADTMTTGIMVSTGTAGKTPNTIVMKGSMPDPSTGKMSSIEQKLTITDADHHTLEMWGPGPDGKRFKMMDIVYTRKK